MAGTNTTRPRVVTGIRPGSANRAGLIVAFCKVDGKEVANAEFLENDTAGAQRWCDTQQEIRTS